MTEILFKVLCDEYEEVARIFFEFKKTGEQIEGTHQIQKWVNNLFEENRQLKMENNELKLLVQNWESLDEEKDEQLDKQNQALKKLKKENEQLKSKNDDMRFLINNISAQRDEFHHGGRENANRVGKLEKENEELKKALGAILIEVKRDITNTNQTGEIRAFINPNSFNLISEVLRKYGALKEWYE